MEDTLDFIIVKLTELLIKEDFENKQRGKDRYVKKSRAYKDLIKLCKDMKREIQ